MNVPRIVPLIMVPLSVAIGVGVLTLSMRRMRSRAQFLVLLVLGVVVGFTFFSIVQLRHFPLWLGVSLMMVVLVASPFAIRTFMRSLIEEDEQANEMQDASNKNQP